jgi:hypothetical protein
MTDLRPFVRIAIVVELVMRYLVGKPLASGSFLLGGETRGGYELFFFVSPLRGERPRVSG